MSIGKPDLSFVQQWIISCSITHCYGESSMKTKIKVWRVLERYLRMIRNCCESIKSNGHSWYSNFVWSKIHMFQVINRSVILNFYNYNSSFIQHLSLTPWSVKQLSMNPINICIVWYQLKEEKQQLCMRLKMSEDYNQACTEIILFRGV